jgi:hypothetical protein
MYEYDVVIIGGGTAGVVAGIQAGRAGAKCLLIEKSGILGGTITLAGVNFPGLFHAWGKQVIAGIGWELVSQCKKECREYLQDFSSIPNSHVEQQIRINPAIFAALCDEAIADAHVTLLLHSMIASVAPYESGWQITLCTKTGLLKTSANVLIDCTGDANAVSIAGFPLRIPTGCQPATLMSYASGYSADKVDIDLATKNYDNQVQQGKLKYTDAGWHSDCISMKRWLDLAGDNAGHITGINARDSKGKTILEVEARKSMLRLYRFLKTQRGLENLNIDSIASECGVRETATIIGKKTVTEDDYVSGRIWEDAVCYSFYPIDLHTADGTGLDCRPLAKGIVPTIPRGAMLPQDSKNLIAAGRCLSSDRLANSALRTQATCMATGQAAGAMAALAVQTGKDVEALCINEIHTLLKAHAAIVPNLP